MTQRETMTRGRVVIRILPWVFMREFLSPLKRFANEKLMINIDVGIRK
jgi:hypothetical protein